MMRARLWWGSVVLAAMLIGGCVVVRPSDAVLLDEQAGNAAAISAKVQTEPAVAAELKAWWASDAAAWKAVADWANGRRPTASGAGN